MNKTMLTGIAGLALGLTTAVGIGAWSGVPVFDDTTYEDWQINLNGNWNTWGLIDTADFDQDGFDDLLVIHSNHPSYKIAVHMNQSGKGFNVVFSTTLEGGSDHWRAADVNADGYPDLVRVGSANKAVVMINQLANEKVCATDLDKSGSTEIGDLLFVIEDWGPCQDK